MAETEEEKESGAQIRNTFHKSERLHHKILVDTLFEKGDKMFEYPFRMVWRTLTEQELKDSFKVRVPEGIGQIQMMVTVPKKKRRHAVDRVRMRRLTREAYRLQRHSLKAAAGRDENIRTLSIAFLYQADKNLPYQKIERKMGILLEKLRAKIEPSARKGV